MSQREWLDGMGYLDRSLIIDERDAEMLASPGESIGTVQQMRKRKPIIYQLEVLKPENVRQVLYEYGAWTDEELEDHDENLNRLLWIAGCDIGERPEDYKAV